MCVCLSLSLSLALCVCEREGAASLLGKVCVCGMRSCRGKPFMFIERVFESSASQHKHRHVTLFHSLRSHTVVMES